MTTLMPAFVAAIAEDDGISQRPVASQAVLAQGALFFASVRVSFYRAFPAMITQAWLLGSRALGCGHERSRSLSVPTRTCLRGLRSILF